MVLVKTCVILIELKDISAPMPFPQALLPFRACGYISELRMLELAERLNRFQKTMVLMGVIPDFSQLALSVFTTLAIPFIRLTEKRYYRFRENDFVGLTP